MAQYTKRQLKRKEDYKNKVNSGLQKLKKEKGKYAIIHDWTLWRDCKCDECFLYDELSFCVLFANKWKFKREIGTGYPFVFDIAVPCEVCNLKGEVVWNGYFETCYYSIELAKGIVSVISLKKESIKKQVTEGMCDALNPYPKNRNSEIGAVCNAEIYNRAFFDLATKYKLYKLDYSDSYDRSITRVKSEDLPYTHTRLLGTHTSYTILRQAA